MTETEPVTCPTCGTDEISYVDRFEDGGIRVECQEADCMAPRAHRLQEGDTSDSGGVCALCLGCFGHLEQCTLVGLLVSVFDFILEDRQCL